MLGPSEAKVLVKPGSNNISIKRVSVQSRKIDGIIPLILKIARKIADLSGKFAAYQVEKCVNEGIYLR